MIPVLDLHGEQCAFVEVLVNDFIKDNIKMRKERLSIVHGKSTNILTKEVHRILKKNKSVKEYRINNWNLGETIVLISIK